MTTETPETPCKSTPKAKPKRARTKAKSAEKPRDYAAELDLPFDHNGRRIDCRTRPGRALRDAARAYARILTAGRRVLTAHEASAVWNLAMMDQKQRELLARQAKGDSVAATDLTALAGQMARTATTVGIAFPATGAGAPGPARQAAADDDDAAADRGNGALDKLINRISNIASRVAAASTAKPAAPGPSAPVGEQEPPDLDETPAPALTSQRASKRRETTKRKAPRLSAPDALPANVESLRPRHAESNPLAQGRVVGDRAREVEPGYLPPGYWKPLT